MPLSPVLLPWWRFASCFSRDSACCGPGCCRSCRIFPLWPLWLFVAGFSCRVSWLGLFRLASFLYPIWLWQSCSVIRLSVRPSLSPGAAFWRSSPSGVFFRRALFPHHGFFRLSSPAGCFSTLSRTQPLGWEIRPIREAWEVFGCRSRRDCRAFLLPGCFTATRWSRISSLERSFWRCGHSPVERPRNRAHFATPEQVFLKNKKPGPFPGRGFHSAKKIVYFATGIGSGVSALARDARPLYFLPVFFTIPRETRFWSFS